MWEISSVKFEKSSREKHTCVNFRVDESPAKKTIINVGTSQLFFLFTNRLNNTVSATSFMIVEINKVIVKSTTFGPIRTSGRKRSFPLIIFSTSVIFTLFRGKMFYTCTRTERAYPRCCSSTIKATQVVVMKESSMDWKQVVSISFKYSYNLQMLLPCIFYISQLNERYTFI